MQYVAAVSGKGADIDRVKEQLLQSNPVLEGGSLILCNWSYLIFAPWCFYIYVCADQMPITDWSPSSFYL